MNYTITVIDLILAAIQIPFFPATINVFVCGFCVALAISSIMQEISK